MSDKTQTIIVILGLYGGGLAMVLFIHYQEWVERRKQARNNRNDK